jgi:hypothetical protein
MGALPLECVRVYNMPPLERRHAMKFKKATTSVFVTVFFVSMAFIAGYVTAQKTENVEWLGWVQVAKPSSSPDPRIHMKKTYDSLVREDIEVGLREDGVVIWRRVQK